MGQRWSVCARWLKSCARTDYCCKISDSVHVISDKMTCEPLPVRLRKRDSVDRRRDLPRSRRGYIIRRNLRKLASDGGADGRVAVPDGAVRVWQLFRHNRSVERRYAQCK